MNDYKENKCPKYSVTVHQDGTANFVVKKEGGRYFICHVDLKKENLWQGREGYSAPDPERHFICHEDGDLVVTPYKHTRLILLEWKENKSRPKIFYRARQWEFDWWMNINFPDSANSKVYQKMKEYINY